MTSDKLSSRKLRAFTLWQPWATLVIAGVKPFEFRRWPAPAWIWGQRVAIHAGARPVKRREIDELIASIRLEGGWGTALHAEPALDILLRIQDRPDLLPTSAVLGTAIIGKPVPAAEAVVAAYGESFRGDSDRIDHSVFGWPMTEVRRFEPPIEAKGAQGFWWWSTTEADVAIERVVSAEPSDQLHTDNDAQVAELAARLIAETKALHKAEIRIKALEEGLKPFAEAGCLLPTNMHSSAPAARSSADGVLSGTTTTLYVKDFRRAADLLNKDTAP